MLSRSLRSPFLYLIALLLASLTPGAYAASAEEEGEAQRLYSRANDYVSRISEDGYSYAYIQFYWKRAEANIERVARVYPSTTIGRQIRNGELKLGPFELDYFRDRVLPRLEEKKLGAFDAVNCAIFLYNLDEKRLDEERSAALQSILEVLARQKRWSEALSFPVLKEQRPLLLATIFAIAARYEQDKVVDEFLTTIATPTECAGLWPVLGEALALRGAPRKDIAKLLDEHPETMVKLAVLSGMVRREVKIRRYAALRIPIKPTGLQLTHYSILHPDVRDDVDTVAKTFFPDGNPKADDLIARYHASLGQKPSSDAAVGVHLAYLEFLAAFDRFDEFYAYARSLHSGPDSEGKIQLKMIELLATAGRTKEADKVRADLIAQDPARADAAAYAEFTGQIDSTEVPFTVREKTFSDLSIKDPCIVAQAIMYHSLAPNRAIRGAAPWDSVVQKFLPGFVDLPAPKSKDVQEAAGASKPY